MYEIGGLAVLPTFQRTGVAAALVRKMAESLVESHPLGINIVTVTWPGGISDEWCARHLESLGQFTDEHGITVNAWRFGQESHRV